MAEKALSIAPENGVAHSAMATAHFYKVYYRSALDYWIDEFQLDEKTRHIIMNTYDEKGYKTVAQVFAEETEISVFSLPVKVALIYAKSGNDFMAMDLFEQAYEDHSASLPYIGKSLFLDGPFKIDDPRLFELLKKMNLPVD